MKLVIIEWNDSHSSNGWKKFSDLEAISNPMRIVSVGWLLKQNRKGVMLVASRHHNCEKDSTPHGCGNIFVPNKAITKVTVLRK